MDYVFTQGYKAPGEIPSYDDLGAADLPEGTTVETSVLPFPDDPTNPNISLISVIVYNHGEEVRTFETLRAKR